MHRFLLLHRRMQAEGLAAAPILSGSENAEPPADSFLPAAGGVFLVLSRYQTPELYIDAVL